MYLNLTYTKLNVIVNIYVSSKLQSNRKINAEVVQERSSVALSEM